ncbi:hypothetical protein YQE_08464, partial [Dendroctonus ponderosae]
MGDEDQRAELSHMSKKRHRAGSGKCDAFKTSLTEAKIALKKEAQRRTRRERRTTEAPNNNGAELQQASAQEADVNHFVTQAISGHGDFGSYLEMIRKQESDQCWLCKDSDTPQHTIFVCRQFEGIRAEAADRCGKHITKDAMETILATKDGWDVIRSMIQDIVETKCDLERKCNIHGNRQYTPTFGRQPSPLKKRKLLDTSIHKGEGQIYKKRESPEYFTLVERREIITKLANDLQNTKREVKEIARRLKRQINVINQSYITQWLNQFKYEKIDKMTIDMDTQTSPKKNEMIAHDLLERITKDDKINVVIGQEPYGKSLIDYHDDNRDSFINVDNKYKVLKSGCGEGFVHVELSNCVVISCYFSPNGNVADFERLLQNMEKVIRHGGKQVVMGGDLNAKTNLIGPQCENEGTHKEDCGKGKQNDNSPVQAHAQGGRTQGQQKKSTGGHCNICGLGGSNSGMIDLVWDDSEERSFQLLTDAERTKVFGTVDRDTKKKPSEGRKRSTSLTETSAGYICNLFTKVMEKRKRGHLSQRVECDIDGKPLLVVSGIQGDLEKTRLHYSKVMEENLALKQEIIKLKEENKAAGERLAGGMYRMDSRSKQLETLKGLELQRFESVMETWKRRWPEAAYKVNGLELKTEATSGRNILNKEIMDRYPELEEEQAIDYDGGEYLTLVDFKLNIGGGIGKAEKITRKKTVTALCTDENRSESEVYALLKQTKKREQELKTTEIYIVAPKATEESTYRGMLMKLKVRKREDWMSSVGQVRKTANGNLLLKLKGNENLENARKSVQNVLGPKMGIKGGNRMKTFFIRDLDMVTTLEEVKKQLSSEKFVSKWDTARVALNENHTGDRRQTCNNEALNMEDCCFKCGKAGHRKAERKKGNFVHLATRRDTKLELQDARALKGLSGSSESKRDDERCMYGDEERDTPEHMLFHCIRFERVRQETVRYMSKTERRKHGGGNAEEQGTMEVHPRNDGQDGCNQGERRKKT